MRGEKRIAMDQLLLFSATLKIQMISVNTLLFILAKIVICCVERCKMLSR